MGIDIYGICQKRENDKWITVSEKPRIFGWRNRYAFSYLNEKMCLLVYEDPSIDELRKEMSRECEEEITVDSLKKYFWRPGCITLAELKAAVREDMEDSEREFYEDATLDKLNQMIEDLEEIWTGDPEDFRVVITFDS